eukprot:TRINITY_DN5678_c0_g2_i1.p1 TRINITY_DN5678_c0_g2~~TRINITY_DN5678_c0_g2_i1.p1  ORF type:complete len:1517 (-),score=285.15 TRINITY_DN5678_c0_g2_i1:208-4758(-)
MKGATAISEMPPSELETTCSSVGCFGAPSHQEIRLACSAAVAAAAIAGAAAGVGSALPLPSGPLPAPEELLARIDWEGDCESGRAVACNSQNNPIVELTWFYDEDVLEAVNDPSYPLRRVSFEVRQQTRLANGLLRTRVHPCDCHGVLGGDACAGIGEVQEQRFRVPGCQVGRSYLLSVRARATFDGSVDPAFSPYTDTIEILVPQRCTELSSAALSLSSTRASGVGSNGCTSLASTATRAAVTSTATSAPPCLNGVGIAVNVDSCGLVREELSAVVDDTPSIDAQEQKQPHEQEQLCQQMNATMLPGELEETWQPGTLEPMDRGVATNILAQESLGFDHSEPPAGTVEADENSVKETLPPLSDPLAVTVTKPSLAPRWNEKQSDEKAEGIEDNEADALTTSQTVQPTAGRLSAHMRALVPAEAAAALDAASAGFFGDASRARVASLLGKQVANALMAAHKVKQEKMEHCSVESELAKEQRSATQRSAEASDGNVVVVPTSPARSVSPLAAKRGQGGFADAFASYCGEQIVDNSDGPSRDPRAALGSIVVPPPAVSAQEPCNLASSVVVDVGTPTQASASLAAVAIATVTKATESPCPKPSACNTVIAEKSERVSSGGNSPVDESCSLGKSGTPLEDATSISPPVEGTEVQPLGNMNRWMAKILARDPGSLVAPKQPRLTPREDDVHRRSLQVADAAEAAEVEQAAAEAAAAVSAIAQQVSDATRREAGSAVSGGRDRHVESAHSSRTVSPESSHVEERIATVGSVDVGVTTAEKQVAGESAGLVPRTRTSISVGVCNSPLETSAKSNPERRHPLSIAPETAVNDMPSVSQSLTQLEPSRSPHTATPAVTNGHPQQLYQSMEVSHSVEREQLSSAAIVSRTFVPPKMVQSIGAGAVGDNFEVGDAVHIWSNSKGAWMTDGSITEVLTAPCVSDGLSMPAGHVLPVGSVKVSSSAGLKWILPEVIATQLRKACPVRKPSVGSASGSLTAGEAVQVWSKSQQTWLTDGRICEVSDGSNSFFNGLPVRVGAVRVVSSAGEKWVMPEQIDAHLRRLAVPAVASETVAGVRPMLAAAMETRIPTAASPVPSFQQRQTPQHNDLPRMGPVVRTQQQTLMPIPTSASMPSSRDDLGPTVMELPKRATAASFPSQRGHQQSTPQSLTSAGVGADGLCPTRMLPSPSTAAGPTSAAEIRRLSSVAEADTSSVDNHNGTASKMMSPMPTSSSFSYSMPSNPQVVSSSAPYPSCAAAVSGGGGAISSVVAAPSGCANEKPLEMSQRLARAGELQRRLCGGSGLGFRATSPAMPMPSAAPLFAPTACVNGVKVGVGSSGGASGLGCGTIDYMPPPQRAEAKSSDGFGSSAGKASGVGCGTISVLPTPGARAAAPAKIEDYVHAVCSNGGVVPQGACGCGTIGALPPPPRGAPASERTSLSAGVPPSSSFNIGGGRADSKGRHILQVLVSEGRWEELCFCQRDDLDQVSSAFLRCHGLKSAFGPSLIDEMRTMMVAGQAEKSVDIIDLL